MIKETCSCGATFETDEKFWTYANEGAAAWRRDHNHETAGIEWTAESTEKVFGLLRPPPEAKFPPAPPEGEFPDGCSYCGSKKHIARECPDA